MNLKLFLKISNHVNEFNACLAWFEIYLTNQKIWKNIVMCKKKKLEKLFEISFDLLFFLILTGSILSYVTS